MKDWKATHDEFSQFGWVEVTARYLYGGIDPRVKINQPPYDMDIMIMIDPTILVGADLSTDTWVRRVIYELAEQAIEWAKQNYLFTRAPYLEVTNELQWNHQMSSNKLCIVSGRLSFSIMDKP